jgi:hypothetical protein
MPLFREQALQAQRLRQYGEPLQLGMPWASRTAPRWRW